MGRNVLLSFIAVAILCGYVNAACSGDFAPRSGPATYYGEYTNGGACTLDPTPFAGTNGIFSTVAISSNYWSGSAVCGLCLNVTSSDSKSPFYGNRLVFVNNQCPGCDNYLIDFGKNGDGKYPVTWTPVACPVGSTTVQYLFQGSHAWYIKLQVRNTRYTVSSLEILQGGVYKKLTRADDNFFLSADSPLTFPVTFPFDVRVTSTTGSVILDTVPVSGSIVNGQVYESSKKVQFPDCGASSTTGTVASTTATSTTAKATTTTTTTAAATSTTAKATTTTATTAATSTTAKSSTSSTATTGTSSTTGAATFQYIYNDKLENGFADWSWSNTATAQDSSLVYSGSFSYGAVLQAWGAAYFSLSQYIDTAKHSSIQFYIRSSVAVSSQFTFALIQADAPVNEKPISTYITGGTAAANTWTIVVVPLSGFTAGKYDGLWLQEVKGATQAKLNIDEVKLFNK